MSHAFTPDPRNDDVIVWVDGELVRRPDAKISVLDSAFLMGDAIWESFRVVDGKVGFLEAHLRRLEEAAAALLIDVARDQLLDALRRTLAANAFAPDDPVHVRLMVTRGRRSTPYQSPAVVVTPPTVVVLPEIKQPVEVEPLNLATVSVRRGRPDVHDPGMNTHSKHNCVSASIAAAQAGADEALMLDPHGFVATCNSTHFFIVRDGEVWTSTGDYCLPGITRANVLRLCRDNGIACAERNFSLTRVYGADEAFVTGTFGGLTPVASVDGRVLGGGFRGPVTERLQTLYRGLFAASAVRP